MRRVSARGLAGARAHESDVADRPRRRGTAPGSALRDDRVTVWLVDDTDSVRKSISAVLSTANIVVRDFDSAEAFLRVFTPDGGGCLVVDQQMPSMTGLQLLQYLQAAQIRIPAILITAAPSESLERHALAAGAIAMFKKPVDGEELIQSVERAGLAS